VGRKLPSETLSGQGKRFLCEFDMSLIIGEEFLELVRLDSIGWRAPAESFNTTGKEIALRLGPILKEVG
jgi:hypothetical protein